MTIGERVKGIRIGRGIKQIIVANALGMSSSNLSALENNVQNPTIQQIEALSKYFDVSIDYLVTGIDVKVSPTDKEILNLIKNDNGLYKSLMDVLTAKKTC